MNSKSKKIHEFSQHLKDSLGVALIQKESGAYVLVHKDESREGFSDLQEIVKYVNDLYTQKTQADVEEKTKQIQRAYEQIQALEKELSDVMLSTRPYVIEISSIRENNE